MASGIKPTIDFVKNVIESVQGYFLISSIYVNNHSPLEIFHADCGKIWITTFKSFSQLGCRCSNCAGNMKILPEFVRAEVEKRGFTLLEDYTGGNKPFAIQCEFGHISHVTFNSFKNAKYGCMSCFRISNRTSDEEIKIILGDYKLISDNIIGRNRFITVECPAGHIYQVELGHFKNGHRCAKCYHKSLLSPTTGLILHLRSMEEIKNWKINILKEADYHCFITGERGGYLHAHHVESFSLLAKTIIKQVCGDNKKIVADISAVSSLEEAFLKAHEKVKGYAMRKDLHMLFHNLYGTKTTEEQLLEFKTNYNNGIIPHKGG